VIGNVSPPPSAELMVRFQWFVDVQVLLCGDGVSGGDDGKVKLWDVKNKAQIKELPGHDKSVISISYSSDGKLLATGSKDYTVKIWQLS